MANKEVSEAAKKIKDAEKAKAKKKKNDKGNAFARFWKAVKRWFKDLKGEIKKITWPGSKEVLKGTVVTIVCIAIIGVVVFLVDLGLTQGIKGLRTVAENRTTTTEAVETAADQSEDQGLAVDVTDASESTTAASAAETTKAAE